MIKSVGYIIFVGILFAGFQNCSSDHVGSFDDSGSSSSANYESLKKETLKILTYNCASCHSVGSGYATPLENILDLESLQTNAYVVAGKPQYSPLYMYLVDGIMPHDQDDLEAGDLEVIRSWILSLSDDPDAGLIEETEEIEGAAENTFSYVYNNVIFPRCYNCHRAGGQRSVTPFGSYDEVMLQVNINNPASSPLYAEILNGNMPPSGGAIASGDTQKILKWIQEGASNN